MDLGCGGMGIKSIYCAQHDFNKAVGVDIAPKAVEYANNNAKQVGVSNNCFFVAGNVLNLSKLIAPDKFDVVVDWALIHCIPGSQRKIYASHIDKFTHVG